MDPTIIWAGALVVVALITRHGFGAWFKVQREHAQTLEGDMLARLERVEALAVSLDTICNETIRDVEPLERGLATLEARLEKVGPERMGQLERDLADHIRETKAERSKVEQAIKNVVAEVRDLLKGHNAKIAGAVGAMTPPSKRRFGDGA